MAEVCLVFDEQFLRHETGSHPERPERVAAIEKHLRESGVWERLRHLSPAAATREEILRAHDERLYTLVTGTASAGYGQIDGDTVFCPETAEVALLAPGAALTAVREVMAGTVSRAMALVRPPGHHATRSRAMGFCFFNNVAVAARELQAAHDVERIAIIDFDVHHGNGTQDIFEDDPGVFFFSIHQDNLFPAFSGRASERGRGRGVGTTLNAPVPGGCPRPEYMAAFEQGLEAVFAWRPQFVLVSAGFDAHGSDPLGGLLLRSEDFGGLTRMIVERTVACGAKGPVSVLEGGYNLRALGESVGEHLRAMGE